MSVPYRVTVRISKNTMNQLEELVENYQYDNVSDVVRKAVDEFVESAEHWVSNNKPGFHRVDCPVHLWNG